MGESGEDGDDPLRVGLPYRSAAKTGLPDATYKTFEVFGFGEGEQDGVVGCLGEFLDDLNLSSGVEAAPGHKDPRLVEQFIRCVREVNL